MNKKWNIVFWIFTIWLSFSLISAAYFQLTRQQVEIDLMNHLGYPIYFLTIIGLAKILGLIGIWQKFSPTLREWAYAGIVFNFAGAIASHVAVKDGWGFFPAGLSLVITAISYIALKRRTGERIW